MLSGRSTNDSRAITRVLALYLLAAGLPGHVPILDALGDVTRYMQSCKLGELENMAIESVVGRAPQQRRGAALRELPRR